MHPLNRSSKNTLGLGAMEGSKGHKGEQINSDTTANYGTPCRHRE